MKKTRTKDETKLIKRLAKALVAVTELAAQLEEMIEEYDGQIRLQYESGDLVVVSGGRKFVFKQSGD